MTAPSDESGDSALCVSYIGARKLRATRVDHCGRPVYGPRSQVVSNGFVSVEIEPESEEGDDFTTKTAGGDLCINEKGQDTIKWYTVSIEFCRVDPDLFQIMNPTWDPVTNYQGQRSGWDMGQAMSDTTGFALELWPKTTNTGTACLQGDSGTEADDREINGYIIMPWLLGTAPESWTLENDAATFTLNARTKAGSLWGRGPYNITHDDKGKPAAMRTPIDPGFNVPNWDGFKTSGDPKHVRFDVVSLKPPESGAPNGCGAFPLWNKDATTPTVEAAATSDNSMSVDFAVSNWADMKPQRGTVQWSKGGTTEELASDSDGKRSHVYPDDQDGKEQVITFTSGNGAEPVTVKFTPKKPSESSRARRDEPDADDDTHTVRLSLDSAPKGNITIDWGDGDTETVTGSGPHRHTYQHAGRYTVVTSDNAGRELTRDEFTVPKEA